MGWEKTNKLGRSIACCGDQLRYFRQTLGWTQQQLASAAGYSERLVRKAEAGLTIHPETVENLAEALCEGDQLVNPEDLVFSPEAVAAAWGRAYREKGRQLTSFYQRYLDEQIELYMAADPNEIPFAGIWNGIDGFDRCWQTFFQVFDRVDRKVTAQ